MVAVTVVLVTKLTVNWMAKTNTTIAGCYPWLTLEEIPVDLNSLFVTAEKIQRTSTATIQFSGKLLKALMWWMTSDLAIASIPSRFLKRNNLSKNQFS